MSALADLIVTSAENAATREIQGTPVPALGFGTYELEGDACRRAVVDALDVGYRHLDTARMYHNEVQVGQALQQVGIDREKIFLTSKIWWDDLSPAGVEKQISASLKDLDTPYLDLVLIHWPNPEFPLEETIEAMVAAREQGMIRHVGVSNFPPSWTKRAIACGPIFCNQVEYHPFLGQTELLELARAHDFLLTAYAPLAQGGVHAARQLDPIAEKHGKSREQVALRWLIEQKQVSAVPRSSKREHIEANFDIFDFRLDHQDHARIARLPKDRRQINPEFAPDWED